MTVPDSDTRKGAAMLRQLKSAITGIKKGVCEMLPTMFLVLGAVAISFGIGLIYTPAGIIAAGGMLMGLGVLLIKGGGEESE